MGKLNVSMQVHCPDCGEPFWSGTGDYVNLREFECEHACKCGWRGRVKIGTTRDTSHDDGERLVYSAKGVE